MAAQQKQDNFYKDPRFARVLFNTARFAWLWAIIRVWLGWQWIEASLHKIGDAAWVGNGAALKGYWLRAVAVPQPPAKPLITFDWYRSAKLVAYGEMLIGVALIIGAFVGIAAFLAGFMNWNFMMAGAASTNPVLFTLSILLILAWKVAGYYGADRYLLPALGTPWKPGKVFTPNRGALPA
ncbi:MAG: DoxX family protein [Bacillati bacterium ANGP1]|uniref:DoxX family protein n=1 Tax=Candidatus Segetimicrobium genomatis TaxID=2569760 RepID=A0A537LL35_9BACT|nr:MAG: DoxX family protein [Terrabacteria group bacterium ANGP1]